MRMVSPVEVDVVGFLSQTLSRDREKICISFQNDNYPGI